MNLGVVTEALVGTQPQSSESLTDITTSCEVISDKSYEMKSCVVAKDAKAGWELLESLAEDTSQALDSPPLDRARAAYFAMRGIVEICETVAKWNWQLRSFSDWVDSISAANTRQKEEGSTNLPNPSASPISWTEETVVSFLQKMVANQSTIIGQNNDILAGQNNILAGQNDLKAGQDDLKAGQDDLKAGQDDIYAHVKGVPRMVEESQDAREHPEEASAEIMRFVDSELSPQARKLWIAWTLSKQSLNATAKETKISGTTARRLRDEEIVPFYEKHHWPLPKAISCSIKKNGEKDTRKKTRVHLTDSHLDAEIYQGHQDPNWSPPNLST